MAPITTFKLSSPTLRYLTCCAAFARVGGIRSEAKRQKQNMSTNLMTASNQWATRPGDQRFTSLAALRDSVNSRRMRSRSVDVDVNRIHVTAGADTIEINNVIAPSEPSHWAFSQFAGLLGAPANYLRSLPKPLLVDCLNAGIKSAPRDAVKFMTIANPDNGLNTLQAVTSPTYGRIWDADVVDGVQRIVDRSGGKFHNPSAYKIDTSKPGFSGLSRETEPSGLFASDRDVFCFMIDGGSRLDAGPRAKMNRGFFCWNSEVGAKTFGLSTFLFNEVCGNLIVWGATEINTLLIRHTKNAPTRFDNEAYPALVQHIESSASTEEAILKRAQSFMLPKDDADLLKLVDPFKITRAEIREARDYANREEGQFASLFDLVQGGTAYARGFDYVDARVDTCKRFSSLLKLAQ